MLKYMELGIFNFLRARFKKRTAPKPALVEVYDDAPRWRPALQSLRHVDFSHNGDLEGYVRGLNVPRETIEQWISTGLLFPDEMKMAEKIIQIMRRQEKDLR